MTDQTKEMSANGKAGIYMQFAIVETENWERLPKESRIIIRLTNSQGQYGKPMPIVKREFQKYFALAAENIYRRKVRSKMNFETNLIELTALDKDGKDTDKKSCVNPETFKQSFQPFLGD